MRVLPAPRAAPALPILRKSPLSYILQESTRDGLSPLRTLNESSVGSLPVLKFRPALRVARAVILFGEVLMATGTVKWFNATKGFGFIQPEDGSKDVFVHISAVERAGIARLNEGQRVSYDVVTERGKSAAGNLKAL